MTYGFSRDDAGKFLNAYYDAKILENDPFAKLDQVGVGKLMKMAIELGKATRPELHVGICGEHGGDPTSVEFCHELGLTYVSCSPFRVPIARLAAAQAAIKENQAKAAAAEETKAAAEEKDEVERKVEAAKAALKEAADKLQSVAADAGAELKDVASAGFKSLLAGWEEFKKTYTEQRNK
jgi:pyruvate,orthophosphate dikinase